MQGVSVAGASATAPSRKLLQVSYDNHHAHGSHTYLSESPGYASSVSFSYTSESNGDPSASESDRAYQEVQHQRLLKQRLRYLHQDWQ